MNDIPSGAMGQRHSWMKTLFLKRKKAWFIPRTFLFQIGNLPRVYQFTVMSSSVLTFTRADDCQGLWCLWTCTNSSTSVAVTQKAISQLLPCSLDGRAFVFRGWTLDSGCYGKTYIHILSRSLAFKIMLPLLFSWGYIGNSSKLSISCRTENICSSK